MTKALPFRLPGPVDGDVDLLVVAAEHSGDQHAGRMVRGVLAAEPERRVAALGGPALAAAGAQLLEDLTAQSTMGFAVFGKLSFYRTLIAEVVRWVGAHRPKAVCFVDSSGLNLRIAKGLFDAGFSAKAGGPTKALYYISPQIWASRAKRRFQMAEHLDGLASIFPFEREVYADTSLAVEFVGHPFVAADYQPPVTYDPAGPVLLLPGSRHGVVKRLFPVMLEAFAGMAGTRQAMTLYPSDGILDTLKAARPPKTLQFLRTGETDGPVGASAVLTTSGTMSMHCALAGIPGVVTYKTDPLTYWLGRMLVKVKFIGIANLLLKEEMYPEFIQGAATARTLGHELQQALENPERVARTQVQSGQLRELLSAAAQNTASEWMRGQLKSGD
ncbi:lipid-A-disaccharide synthase [Synoicihabitans lomoniglobus]|uniref:Lipid-A-disaccharide synthase n=1 Tax=Synoicihabitans lomoniglobus TaxID=2909285 RepID=A0AAE9ZUK8_9BACT|nr:lipid-A-disaccharide synthase [Opitutaceae bacterium LMO-M01]WED63299.1 lipid-A-disaccharide synthase [Opitutaceae bacterium LMO-M01]